MSERDELAALIRENVWNVRGLGIEGEREGWLWESRFGDAPLPEAVADAILAAGWARTTCGHRSPFDDPCAEPVGHSGDHRTANRLRGWANLSFTWSPGDDITEELVAELKAAGWRAPTTCQHVWEHGWADTEKECQCCHEREPLD